MSIDYKKYRKHLKHSDMTTEQKDNLIRVVHRTMENFVDRAFDTDPVQEAFRRQAIENKTANQPESHKEA